MIIIINNSQNVDQRSCTNFFYHRRIADSHRQQETVRVLQRGTPSWTVGGKGQHRGGCVARRVLAGVGRIGGWNGPVGRFVSHCAGNHRLAAEREPPGLFISRVSCKRFVLILLIFNMLLVVTFFFQIELQ